MLEMLQARKEQLEAQGTKGFTLMEMLIVIAIIAVLIAIAIPIFAGQTERAAEATDAANLRSAYATASVQALEKNANVVAGPVTMTQGNKDGWESDIKTEKIGGTSIENLTKAVDSTGKVKDTYYVKVATNGTVTLQEAASTTDGEWNVDPISGAGTKVGE